MKLSGNKLKVVHTPLRVAGSLIVTGGPLVQFYDGSSYTPNREGTPASPIILTHLISAVNIDSETTIELEYTTSFYENNTPITSSSEGYELLPNALKVNKNILPGESIEIKAVSQFVDARNNKIYERQDSAQLRTIIKAEAQYQLALTPSGVVEFDGYRNPNTETPVNIALKQGTEVVQNIISKGFEIRWLNSSGLDIEANELYVDTIPAGREGILVDKTYIDHEMIRCEIWKDNEMLARDSVTFIRKFNSIRTEVEIPELPLYPGVNQLTCSLQVFDHLGNIDVDSAFLVKWMVIEGSTEKEVGEGANASIPVSSIDLKAANLEIYPDIRRREAFAAVTTMDGTEEALLTDDNDNVLTVETFGI